jgi:hypothetical protein
MSNWKMPKAVKSKWLRALRSGKYRQTRTGMLYNSNSDAYCCIGVLQHCLHGGTEGHATPSYEWYRDAGIDTFAFPEETLTKFNDISHYSFSKIADWVQKNIKGV